MALQHASSAQVFPVQGDGAPGAPFSSIALVKTGQLELIRLVLPKGKGMPSHQVAGDITVQCLQGEIAFEAHGRSQTLHAGEMLYLAGGAPHSLRAESDAVALLTIVLAPA